MDVKARLVTKVSEREIMATRIIDAPRDLVFEAWTKPEHVQRWYGPRYFTMTSCRIDLRPGGSYRYMLRGPDGIDYVFSGVYREVMPPARVVDTWNYEAFPGHEAVETSTFDDRHGQTELTTRALFKNAEDLDLWARAGGREGMVDSLDRLEELVARLFTEEGGEQPFVITRTFNAPREHVFSVWSEQDHLLHWWGPKGFTMRAATVDLRPGGIFHYAMLSPDGRQIWGKFVYREIVAPERLVFVTSFSDEEGRTTRHPYVPNWPLEMSSTVTFNEDPGGTGTILTVQWLPLNPTEPERKAFAAGHGSMRQGWTGTFDRLAAYLAGTGKGEKAGGR